MHSSMGFCSIFYPKRKFSTNPSGYCVNRGSFSFGGCCIFCLQFGENRGSDPSCILVYVSCLCGKY